MPAFVGVNENLPLTRIVPESNDPSLAVMVWLDGPAFVHVMAVPTVPVRLGGSKLKSTMRTWLGGRDAVTVWSAIAVGDEGVDVANGVSTVEFGMAGPVACGAMGPPGVFVDEMTIGRDVGVDDGAKPGVAPQAARPSMDTPNNSAPGRRITKQGYNGGLP